MLIAVFQVAAWLLDLGLPHHIAEKYIKLFEEEVCLSFLFSAIPC